MQSMPWARSIVCGLVLVAGAQAQIEFEEIPIGPGDHAGQDPQPLSRACAPSLFRLRHYFGERGVRFDRKLVHAHSGRYCHLFYEPTKRGFEAEEKGKQWIAGRFNSQKLLLVSKLEAGLVEEDAIPAGVSLMISKLPWVASDLFLIQRQHPGEDLKILYGESTRGLIGRAVGDAEYEYLLKVEFGVDRASKISKGKVPG